MKKRRLPFYRSFACLADKCPANCCLSGFHLTLFDYEVKQMDSFPAWQNIDGKGSCLRSFTFEGENGVEICANENGECIFHQNNNLCALQCKNGPEALPAICRTYPRVITRRGDYMEFALDPCCPNVSMLARDWKIGELEETGNGVMCSDEKHRKRDAALSVLADESLSLEESLSGVSELMSAGIEVPALGLSELGNEFIRKVFFLLIWCEILPYEHLMDMSKMTALLLKCVLDFAGQIKLESMDDWNQMSLQFSKWLVKVNVESGIDFENEETFIDSNQTTEYE